MQHIKFPVQFQFKIFTFSNDFTAKDADGDTIAYVKQKLFKLKEDISIYTDDTQSEVVYKIKADRWLDFSAAYSFFDNQGIEFGKVVRKGWRSIWKAEYQIIDENEKHQYTINEDNAWTKVFDSLLGEIPILGMLTGYFFNPSYTVRNVSGKEVVQIKKQASFFGRDFELTQVGDLDADDDDRVLLGLMMMLLLERSRG